MTTSTDKLTTDKLTIQALKQHDKIHPKLQATTSTRSTQPGVPPQPIQHKDSQTGSEGGTKKRTVSILSDTGSKQRSPDRANNRAAPMTIFRLVAATRTWQRLAAKRKKQPPTIPVRYENTYQLQPDLNSKFSVSKVEAILRDVLESRLKNVRYDADHCRRITTDLAGVIKARTKTCQFQRYKLVCNVLIMENKGQGSQVVSRGLTNADTDSYAAYTYRNPTLVAVAHVHGLYFE